jgi:hypothetical protein
MSGQARGGECLRKPPPAAARIGCALSAPSLPDAPGAGARRVWVSLRPCGPISATPAAQSGRLGSCPRKSRLHAVQRNRPGQESIRWVFRTSFKEATPSFPLPPWLCSASRTPGLRATGLSAGRRRASTLTPPRSAEIRHLERSETNNRMRGPLRSPLGRATRNDGRWWGPTCPTGVHQGDRAATILGHDTLIRITRGVCTQGVPPAACCRCTAGPARADGPPVGSRNDPQALLRSCITYQAGLLTPQTGGVMRAPPVPATTNSERG